MTDSVFDIALERRFVESEEIVTINVTSADNLLIRDSATGVIMRLPFSTLAAAISSAFGSAFASLVDGKVPASQLPSYVDDVLEYANFAAFPATGESGKIYVAINTNKTYRWSGSTYVEISASPGSTDAVPEGATNLYHTTARASTAAPVQSVAGRTGNVTLTATDVAEVTNKKYTTDAQQTNLGKLANFANTQFARHSNVLNTGLNISYSPVFAAVPSLMASIVTPQFGDELEISSETESGATFKVKNQSANIEENGAAGFEYNHSSIHGWGAIVSTHLTDIKQIAIKKDSYSVTYTDSTFTVELRECSAATASGAASGTVIQSFTVNVSTLTALANGDDLVLNLTNAYTPIDGKFYAVLVWIASTSIAVKHTGDTAGTASANFIRGIYTTNGSTWANTNPNYGLYFRLVGNAGYVARSVNWCAIGN